MVPDVQFDLGPSGAEAAPGLGVATVGAGGAGAGFDRLIDAAAGAGSDGSGFDGLVEAVAAGFEGAKVTVTVGVTVIVVVADSIRETDSTLETAAGGNDAAFVVVAGEISIVVIKVVIGMTVISWLAGPWAARACVAVTEAEAAAVDVDMA